MDIDRETITHNPDTGDREVVHTHRHISTEAELEEERGNRVNAAIWYIVGILNTLLFVRIVLLLFGANNTGFASFIYGITHPFVVPFTGIFSSPSSGTGYFDIAALLAMIVYALVAWALASLVAISTERTTHHHHTI